MKIVVIVGSTGVGKTDFAFELARYISIEIINADLGQFYEPFSIGTAKPDWKNSSVAHHLFDIMTTPHAITAFEYRHQVQKKITQIINHGNTPVIVGGSTFYVESLFFELPSLGTLTQHSLYYYDQKETSQLWHELYGIDALRAQAIHHNDRYRIIRALQQWYQTGIKPSTLTPTFSPVHQFEYVYLFRDREDLYVRINQRVDIMLAAGWLDEVHAIMNTPWEAFVLEKKFIGYPELIAYSNNKTPALAQVSSLIAQKTRNYAKRQETYWRRLEKKISHCLVTTPEYTNTHASCIASYNITKESIKDCINRIYTLKKK